MNYDIDRIWQRISQRDPYKGTKLSDLGYQAITLRLQLTSQQASGTTPIQFSAGACVFGVTAGARPDAIPATTVYGDGLDLFEVQTQYQQQRYIVGNANIFSIGSAVFGKGTFNGFPGEELIMPANAQLDYSFINLCTTTINVWVVHHVLVPRGVG